MFHDTFNDLFASLFRGDLRLVRIGTHTVVSVVLFNNGLVKRGGCLPVIGSGRMIWKYDDDKCRCGLVETEMHVLFECTLYGDE